MLVACLLAAGVSGTRFSAYPADAAHERIIEFNVRGDVRDDGSLAVRETIEWDFGPLQDRSGIYRFLPVAVSPQAPIKAQVDDGPVDLLVTSEASGTRLRVGDPDITLTGRHTFDISYPLPNVVQADWVHWNAIGLGWEIPIEQARVDLRAPFQLVNLDCSQGHLGAKHPCDVHDLEPSRVTIVAHDLAPGEGIKLDATVGDDLDAPRHTEKGWLDQVAWSLPAVALVIGLLAASIFRRQRYHGT